MDAYSFESEWMKFNSFSMENIGSMIGCHVFLDILAALTSRNIVHLDL